MVYMMAISRAVLVGDKMFFPASTFKTFSGATVLDGYGPDYRFKTRVYRTGALDQGLVEGDLVMVLMSLLAARSGRVCFGLDGLVLDKDLLGLGDGLRTPGCGECQRYKAKEYPDYGEVVTQPHWVGG